MHLQNIKAVVDEINDAARGQPLGLIYQISPYTLVFDLRSREGTHLLVSIDPRAPRIHLTTRKLREIEKQSISPGPFVQFLRSVLRHAELVTAEVPSDERIVRLVFKSEAETGELGQVTLVAQLTGRSANLFLLDNEGRITHALRTPRGAGQLIGDNYQSPPAQQAAVVTEALVEKGSYPKVSVALDAYYREQEANEQFHARVRRVEEQLRRQIRQKEKLLSNLKTDLDQHRNPEEQKRLGDLLLANISTAEREGELTRIRDYYSAGEPVIELKLDSELTLQEHAVKFFNRYSKSKRALQEIKQRIDVTEPELKTLREQELVLEKARETRDESLLESFTEKKIEPRSKKQDREKLAGIRRYVSSDEYEILVGRAAQTNDRLTFKIAKPNDLWLHAADYPGSHVVVRNHSRQEIPHRTIIEAAQLAARFSQAAADARVDVHYTQRKYLSKPKGAAPGLVRLSQFKTITVTPNEAGKRIIG